MTGWVGSILQLGTQPAGRTRIPAGASLFETPRGILILPKSPKSSKVKVSEKLPGPSALYHCITLKVSSPPAVCNSITGTHPGIMLVLGFPAKKRDTKLSKVGAKPQETNPPRQWSSMVQWWRLRQCSHGSFNVSMEACHSVSVAFVDCISTGS